MCRKTCTLLRYTEQGGMDGESEAVEIDDVDDASAEDLLCLFVFFFSSRRRHTRFDCDWSSDVCSSDLEGYSEDPEIVRAYAGRIVRGLQGVVGSPSFLNASHIVATAKHFIGDGGTANGVDRGDNRASERELRDIHGQGYIGAIGAGVQTVMASYNSWQGIKVHGHRYLLTDVLKERLGFDGLVVSDWDGIDGVQGCSKDHCAHAINAGIDLVMVPTEWKAFLENTVAQVRAGDIPESRIDEAVTRILRVKMRAGLFEKGRPSSRPLADHRALLGSPEHRAVPREGLPKAL